MKAIRMDDVTIVHGGEPWPYDLPPCNKSMIRRLEGREDFVYWLQPTGSGDVNDQFPALRFRGQFWNLSLRIMKAIWRPVRLRKGFVNQERAPYGGLKLRIPVPLYHEKMRTQHRFHVLRSMDEVVPAKDRKFVHNASSKVTGVIQKMLAPLVEHEIGDYVALDGDDTSLLLDKVRRLNPEGVVSREELVKFVHSLYTEVI